MTANLDSYKMEDASVSSSSTNWTINVYNVNTHVRHAYRLAKQYNV